MNTRQIVLERDQHRCVRCGEYVGPFGDFSIHHRRPRGMGGSKRTDTHHPANLLTLCGSGTTGCHGWVESHRDEARSLGYLVAQSATPSTVVVRTHRGWAAFTNDGAISLEVTDV